MRATVPGDQFEQPTPAPPALPRAVIPDSSVFRLSSETLAPQIAAPASPVIARSPEALKFETVSPVSPLKPVGDAEASVSKPTTTRQGKRCLSRATDK